MAKVPKGSVLDGVSGTLGKQLVIKHYAYGTVVSAYPDMSKVKRTPLQKKEQSRFAQAVAYAQSILRDPERKAAYAAKLEKGRSVYHAAIREGLGMGNGEWRMENGE